jgi:hypothetical protein
VPAVPSGPVDGAAVQEFLERLGVDDSTRVEQVVIAPFAVEVHLIECDADGKVVVADGEAVRQTITRPIQRKA